MISLVFADGQIRLILTEIIRSGGRRGRSVSVSSGRTLRCGVRYTRKKQKMQNIGKPTSYICCFLEEVSIWVVS